MPGYVYPRFPFTRCTELDGIAGRHPVVIAGGGPVGLTAALELAARGIRTVVLEAGDTVSEGSRALCWAKRSLEILDRHGVARRMLEKGFTWNAGRVYHGDDELYRFELQPQGRHKHPAFINLQQYYAEQFLVEAIAARPSIEIRWRNTVTDVRQDDACVVVEVETPDGCYLTHADWLIAADGARSAVRRSLGIDFAGRVFEDHFLIADVDVHAELPSEDRRFWFRPSFTACDTALCHKQGDNMWRVDFQLGWDIDASSEKTLERALPRIQGMLGAYPMDVTWISIYTFQARRVERFRHGRVLFAGDAAHQISPFGARGGNSGLQDVDNLAWKLALVVEGKAPETLLDSYDAERGYAADENIRITSRTTDFLTPKTPASRAFRDAVLQLAGDLPFARTMVNSGRLSTPTVHRGSPLSSEFGSFGGGVEPGAPCPNLPVPSHAGNRPDRYLLDVIGGRFQGLYFAAGQHVPAAHLQVLTAAAAGPVPVESFVVAREAGGTPLETLLDADGALAEAFDATDGTYYLLRPDQHVAARWRRFDPASLPQALDRALGMEPER